ncbi:hypothetical protein OfM1_08010 [Lactovum odontotermitis]
MNRRLFVYEWHNVVGNVLTILFGLCFPVFMSLLFTRVFSQGLPHMVVLEINTSIFLTMMMIAPLSTMFIGYAATYSQEVENDIPTRLELFGLHGRSVLLAKLFANGVFLVATAVIYIAIGMTAIDMYKPAISGIFFSLLAIILVGGILLIFAHGIVMICRRFSTTYAVTMTLYFAIMVLCGMMGVQVSQFPDWIQHIAKLLPMTYMGMSSTSGFIHVWRGQNFQAGSFLLSLVFLLAAALLVLGVSRWKNRRR